MLEKYLAKIGTPECKSLIDDIRGKAKADGKFKSAESSKKVKTESLIDCPSGSSTPSFIR